tara:strand:+ start:1713 stop:1859 length:147 start_codon:yes stop_codon:yes gene_type:complete
MHYYKNQTCVYAILLFTIFMNLLNGITLDLVPLVALDGRYETIGSESP